MSYGNAYTCPVTDIKDRRMYLFLVVLTVAGAAAFQGWRTLLNNFAVEVGGVDGAQMGVIQSVREVPGFLALLAVYALLVIREHRLAAVSMVVLGLGVASVGLLPFYGGIALTTVIMSFGFHYYETMNQSLTLQYFGVREAPLVMGRMRSLSALTNIVTGAVVWLASSWMGYGAMFALFGAVAVSAGLWALTVDPTRPDMPLQHKKVVLRGKYWLFYLLTLLSGARRQIFVAFAVFLLVTRFGYSIQAVTLLFVGNNIVNYVVNPLIGKAVNRFGERKLLTLEYGSLVLIFIGYALTDSAVVAGALYVLDNVVFNFAIGIKTFYQKIADPGDMATGMATGFTINHIAAVFIPALGGLVWMTDASLVFFGAAGLALVSLVLAQFVDSELALAETRKAQTASGD